METNLNNEQKEEVTVTIKELLQKGNFMLDLFPKLIKDLVEEGFPVSIDNLKEGYFAVGDFYKTGILKLIIDKDKNLIAFDKEGNKGLIETIEQVVELNFYWWISSQTKQGFPQLTKHWTEQFAKRKWLKVVRIYTPDIEAFEESKVNKKETLNQKNETEELKIKEESGNALEKESQSEDPLSEDPDDISDDVFKL